MVYIKMVELMRIRFKLGKTCPKFVKEYEGTDVPYDEQMRILGFNSAEYHEETWMHSLSEEEFTWFVLRFSS